MRKRIVVVLISCMAFAALSAQPSSRTKPDVRSVRSEKRTEAQELPLLQSVAKYEGAHLQMDHVTYNFGDVQRKGGDLIHDIRVVNDGSTPLVITRVATSCSCLKASFPKRPMPPGSSSVIRIIYEPHKSEQGTFHKVIQVYSNSVDGRQIITVRGNSLDPDKM